MSDSSVLAAVNVGGKIELREFARPEPSVDSALLRIEAAGICGSDVKHYESDSHLNCIMGHENLGVIEEIGAAAASRWGVDEGDRVLLEEYVPCWHCEWCLVGEFRLCLNSDFRQNSAALRFGRTPITVPPQLWGGYSQYLYLPPGSVLHPLDRAISGRHAAMSLPIANGIQWCRTEAGISAGSSVVILGPGQQGLGCALAAIDSGASTVIVAGKASDEPRLKVARALGVHHTVDVDREDLSATVEEVTSGRGVDAVVDTTSGSTNVLDSALPLLKRKAGIVVLQGGSPAGSFPLEILSSKYATVKIARGHSHRAVEQSMALIASGRHDLDLMATHVFGLSELDQALRLPVQDAAAIHITIDPWI